MAPITLVARCATFSMAPLDLLDHLLNFVAPAFAVGFLCAILGRFAMRRAPKAPAWWAQGAINFVVGVAVLAAGLIVFGRDGKMATYAALVVACGTSQWLVAGGWRR
jgi:4-amino-4-deoxy-L-arabinose transferase-like glycosyltransferase